MVLGALAIFGCAAGAGVFFVSRAPMLVLEPGTQTVTVPINTVSFAEFTVRNNHPWRNAEVEFVKAQCGCFRVGEFPKQIASGKSGRVTLEILIGPNGGHVHNTLQVHLASGGRLEADIDVAPIPPFAGWPKTVEGDYDPQSQTTLISIDSRYRAQVVLAQGQTPSGDLIETFYDPEQGTIALVDPTEGAELSLTFMTPDGEDTWTGQITAPTAASGSGENPPS